MTPLTLDKALEVYKLLKDYLPDGEDSIIDIAHGILDEVGKKEADAKYIESVSIMNNVPVKVLIRRESEEILDMFLEGLSVNSIVDLKDFCEGIGM